VEEIILRSSTRINTNDPGWATNSAGLRFHHGFGAGLIHAAAAVAMAETWVNRTPSRTPIVSTQTNSTTILNHTLAEITRSFVINSSMRVEHVTMQVSITHTNRGDLVVTLTSPSGMVSSRKAHGDVSSATTTRTILPTSAKFFCVQAGP